MFSLYAEGGESTQPVEARLRVIRLAAAGQSGMQRLYNTIVDRNLNPQGLPVGARVGLVMPAQLMDIAAAFGSDGLRHTAMDSPTWNGKRKSNTASGLRKSFFRMSPHAALRCFR
jgi:hypothetical protein